MNHPLAEDSPDVTTASDGRDQSLSRVPGAPPPHDVPPNASIAMQLFLFLDMSFRMFVWSTSIALACAVFNAFDFWPDAGPIRVSFSTTWKWGSALSNWVLLCNVIYLCELLAFRLIAPLPKTGVYPTNRKIRIADRRSRQLIWASFQGILTKARYQAPFPAFLVYHLSCLPPMRWLVNPIFGPRTKSTNLSEPLCLDPSFITIGKNVIFGSNATIAGHIQVPDMLALRRTTIEDDVLIGANCIIFGGAHIKKGAIVAAGSVVSPYCVIGPNEYWSGVPAAKIRDFK